jgi:hypothetical protein
MTDITGLATAVMAIRVFGDAKSGKRLTSHLSLLSLDPDSGVYRFEFTGYPANGYVVATLTVDAARRLTEFVAHADGLSVDTIKTTLAGGGI